MYNREICKSEALQKTTQIKIKQVVMSVYGADTSTCTPSGQTKDIRSDQVHVHISLSRYSKSYIHACKSRLFAKLAEAVHLDVYCDELLGCGCDSIYADL